MSKLQDELFDFFQGTPKLLVYKEMPLGSVFLDAHTQRADVLTMTKSYNTRIRIYEVKESRADFLSDVRRGKYEGYLSFCHQLYFAVPKGLIKKEEVPAGCGLITFSADKGWHVVNAPVVHKPAIDQNFLMACLFRGQEYALDVRRLRDRISMVENVQVSEMAKNVSWAIRRRLSSVEPELEKVRKAKALIDEFLGRESRDLQNAVWCLERFLKRELPGLQNISLAQDLLTVATTLVNDPENSLLAYGAFQRIEEFVQERKENGSS